MTDLRQPPGAPPPEPEVTLRKLIAFFALVFGMFTMHGSLDNVSNRYRLSCDTRYQRAEIRGSPR